jgi:hypothetical protein
MRKHSVHLCFWTSYSGLLRAFLCSVFGEEMHIIRKELREKQLLVTETSHSTSSIILRPLKLNRGILQFY